MAAYPSKIRGSLRLISPRVLGVCALVALPHCESRSSQEKLVTKARQALSAVTASRPEIKQLGAKLTPGREVALNEVLQNPQKYETEPVIVSGVVRRACSRKGCWLELASSRNADAPWCRVTFQDYAFFVPTDSAGSHAKVQARVELNTMRAEHVQHLEEEGAKFPEKTADGTVREVRLVATGVELWRD